MSEEDKKLCRPRTESNLVEIQSQIPIIIQHHESYDETNHSKETLPNETLNHT